MNVQNSQSRKLSFLMSCYSKDDHIALKEALFSINEPTELLEFQVVLVLDGPVGPDLWSVIRGYKDVTKNELLVHPLTKNIGLGLALNAGAQLCTGEYIFRLDSDDISISSRVHTCVSFLDNNKEVGVVGGYIEEFNYHPGDRKQLRQVPHENEEIRSYSKFRNPMNHVSVCFRASFFQSVNYQDMPLYEDYYLWILALRKGLILRNLDEIFVHVRVLSGIGSRRSGWNYFSKDIKFAKALFNIGHIRGYELVLYLTLRLIVRFLPPKSISYFYKLFLRKES
jgi:glycosyltransferase involved in cell wall biosynthesis